MGERVKVTVDVEKLSLLLKESGRTYITVKGLAEILGTSTKSAGKIMSRLEALGYVERYSRRTYRISWRA